MIFNSLLESSLTGLLRLIPAKPCFIKNLNEGSKKWRAKNKMNRVIGKEDKKETENRQKERERKREGETKKVGKSRRGGFSVEWVGHSQQHIYQHIQSVPLFSI